MYTVELFDIDLKHCQPNIRIRKKYIACITKEIANFSKKWLCIIFPTYVVRTYIFVFAIEEIGSTKS